MSIDRSGELPTQRSEDGDEAAGDAFVLTVVEGVDAGAAFAVDPGSPARLLVGKSVTCGLRLADPEVSRRHASLRPEGRGLVLSDLTSTNGTFVNGVSVREAVLVGGEAIRVGRTVIAVTRRPPTAIPLVDVTSFGRMLGGSRVMRLLYPVLERFAARDEPVLIEGEVGVGKQLCAEEIHARSSRRGRPVVVVAAQTLAPDAIERVLFGPEGAVAQAAGGTVLVEEVAALPYGLQRALAKMLERDLGASLVFTTRRDLDREVDRGTFREELLVRLAPWRLELPPLRERSGDVELLARAFWNALDASPLPNDFLARFHRYRWPGNVRELATAVAARFHQGELGRWRAGASDETRDPLGAVVDRELPLAEAKEAVIEALERRYVRHMLERYGSTREAARASNVGVRYFQILRARFDL